MNEALQTLINDCKDPRLIRGIHNYCHRWCERCPFTDRCSVFRETSRYERDHPDSNPLDQVKDSLEQTLALLAEWCKREGIDFEKLQEDPASDEDEASADADLTSDTLDADSLFKAAGDYGHRAFLIVKPLLAAERIANWSPEVRSAIETLAWYSSMIPAKVHRAVHGYFEAQGHKDEPILQSDWNLTAKAARMAIAESIRAWKIVLEVGDASPESPLRELVDLLV